MLTLPKRQRSVSGAARKKVKFQTGAGTITVTRARRKRIALPQPELKMFPTNTWIDLTALTYVDQSLCSITEGADYSNRDGRKISPVGLTVRDSFVPGDANANVNFRRVIFIDWGYQGVAHGYADVFYNTSPLTVKSYQQTERIQILKDDYMNTSNYLGASGQRSALVGDFYIDLRPYFAQANRRHMQFNGTGAGTEGVGAIFVALLCDKTIVHSTTTNVGYQIFSGLTFVDA